ncbi:hypothetical protein [Kitasatospora herbaricolor]|uniref:Uncharacterized protein n=1 Tax=Kitasatospora herbaricolor TaxID=68217 RepID=A0ABZ1WH24_9ACTN|nr:hypothetical protein [Kitasatospora herbaricolor]
MALRWGHLVDWEADPGSTEEGNPSADAPADFVVLLNPATGPTVGLRVAVRTFETDGE